MNCYWFWFKGKITRKRRIGYDEIYDNLGTKLQISIQNLAGKCEWNGIRFRNGFYTVFDIFLIKYTMSGRWNGQTKSEFDKNFKRVSDIVAKSDGDKEKAIRLAKQQTAKITDEWKAINRAMAAKQAGHEYIFEVFFQRAYELGTVSKQEYREYKLEKLGI
jgi:hypothetical protein